MDIYGKYKEALEAVMAHTARQIEEYGAAEQETTGEMLYEHLRYRLKSEESMVAKLQGRSLPLTAGRHSAACAMRWASASCAVS